MRPIEKEIEEIIDAIPDILFEFGLSGKFYDSYSSQTKPLASLSTDYLGNTIFEIFPKEAAEATVSAIRKAYSDGFSCGQQYTLDIPKIGKRDFELSISRKPTKEGDEPRFIVISRDITNCKEHREKLKHSEDALARSKAFNSSVFDSLSEHIAVIDSNGVIISVNAAWKRFARENGVSESSNSFIGINYLDVCAMASDYPNALEADAATTGILSVMSGLLHEFKLEYPCHSPNEQRWFQMHVTPMTGLEKGVVIMHMNITDRIKAEEELKKVQRELMARSQVFNSSILDSLSEHIAVLDSNGVIISVNAAWKRFAEENGVSESSNSFIGINYLDVCASSSDDSQVGQEADAVNAGIRSVMDGTVSEFNMEYPCHSDIERRWFSLRVIPMQGQERCILVKHRNITKRKLLEHQREFERRDKDALINSTKDFIWSVNRELKLIAGNKSFIRSIKLFYGVTLSRGNSILDTDAFSPEQLNFWEDLYRKALSGESLKLEYQIHAMEKLLPLWLEVTMNPIWNDQEIIGIACYGKDITTQKKQEQEKEQLILELTQNNNDLLQFSYIISHNIRSPLSNLLGLLILLEDITIDDEYIRQILEGFKLSTHSLNNTLKDLYKIISIKKQPSIDREEIHLRDIVVNIMGQLNNRLMQSQAYIETNFEIIPSICFNKVYMESIFLNLFTNAIKYKAPNRNLVISIHTEDRADKILLVFEDNGIGIDVKRFKDRLFGLYQKFHNHPESKGFGLYLIKSQIESLGGSIEVESTVNVGTKFLIKFPRC